MQCFVIMPFGRKSDEGRKAVGADNSEIDFNDIYGKLIEPAISEAGLEAVRTDRNPRATGDIMKDMMDLLAHAPIALIDATFYNPNAFYELGVRHALKACVTVAIRARGWDVPYDVRNLPFFEYALENGALMDLPGTVSRLTDHIRECMTHRTMDSPVLQELGLGVTAGLKGKRLKSHSSVLYSPSVLREMKIGLRTGDITEVTDVDVWVNSENDRMQMARTIERSISSTIRYLGARVNDKGEIIQDHVADNLAAAVRKRLKTKKGEQPRVELGTVFDTDTGALDRKHNVKRLFHVATVTGKHGQGFKVGEDLNHYVRNVIMAVEEYNNVPRNVKLRSMLIPVFGSGQANSQPEDVTDQLVSGCVEAVRALAKSNTPPKLSRIEFLAFSTREYEALERSFGKYSALGELAGREGPQSPPIG